MHRILLSCLLFSWAALCAAGQKAPPVVSAQSVMATDAAHAGATARAAVVAQIAPGYHINDHKPTLEYLIPSQLKLEAIPEITVQDIDYPHGTPVKFEFEDKPLSVYQGTVVIQAVLKIPRTTQPGVYTLQGKFAYQACNDHACFPPTSAPVELSVKVVPANVAVKHINQEIFKSIKIE